MPLKVTFASFIQGQHRLLVRESPAEGCCRPPDTGPALPGLSDFAGPHSVSGSKTKHPIASRWCVLERRTETSSQKGCSTAKETGPADNTLSFPPTSLGELDNL